MRRAVALILLVAAFATAAATSRRTHRPTPADRAADSLFDATAYDSLLGFAQLEIMRARAAGDSIEVGRMIYQRGRARQILRLPGGRKDLDRAHAIALTEGDTLGLISAIGVKSFFAMVDGQFDECLRLNAERIPLAKAIGNRRSEGWGHLLVGYVNLLRENLSVARSEYDAAVSAFRDARRPQQELTALIGLARVCERQGEIAESRRVYWKALALAHQLGDKGQESDVWNNLASMEHEHGDLAVCERYFRRAYELKRQARAPDLAVAAGNVAEISVLLGSYSAAESVLVDAIAYTREWQNTLGMQDLQCTLGTVRAAQGRYAGAVQCYRRALAIYGSIEDRVEAATGLADVLVLQDHVGAAIAVLDTHLVDLSRVSPSRWRSLAFVTWARCLREGGDIPRAGRVARAAWDDAASRSDTTAAVVAATELGTCLRAAGEVERAYEWFQRARAMFVAAMPRASEFRLREAQRVSLAEPLVALSPVLLEWPRDAKRGERERDLFDFIQEIKARTLLERVADPRRAPDLTPAFSQPVTASELASTVLRDGECLIDYTLAGNEVLAFAATHDGLRLSRIANADEVRKQVSRYHRLLAQRPAENSEPGDVRAAARSLGATLLGGLGDVVRSSQHVYVATDGWLAALPMETLVCPDVDDEPLLVQRDVMRVPSASLLRLQRARPAHAYAGGDAASLLAVPPPPNELQGARREVSRLASRYRNVDRLGASDHDDFIDAIARHDVVHVATHVRVDAERPWNSGILIASPAAGAARVGPTRAGAADSSVASDLAADPYARAGQIAAARSDARLVVLSGCESALGRTTQGEGVLGVAAAFFAAGAHSLVASIWEVDDRTTADLMERFYTHLATGESVAAALRSAQLSIRDERPHPFYWAGFVAIGDADVTVRLERRPAGHRVVWLFGALIVVSIATWAIMRGRGSV